MKIATVRLDLAKSVLQVHAVDSQDHLVARKQLRRTDVLRYFAKLDSDDGVKSMQHCTRRNLASAVQHHVA